MLNIFGLSLPSLGDPFTIDDPENFRFDNPADVISRAFQYIIPIAGLILFFMIIASGFQLLASGGNPESIQKGQKRLTYSIVGFLIIFASYWIGELIEVILGIEIF